jgi:hypothetical protein
MSSKHSVVRLRRPVTLSAFVVNRLVTCNAPSVRESRVHVVSPRRAQLTRDAGSGRNPLPLMRIHIVLGYRGRVSRKVALGISIGYEPTIHGWKGSI